jgi:hypothetical protein
MILLLPYLINDLVVLTGSFGWISHRNLNKTETVKMLFSVHKTVLCAIFEVIFFPTKRELLLQSDHLRAKFPFFSL